MPLTSSMKTHNRSGIYCENVEAYFFSVPCCLFWIEMLRLCFLTSLRITVNPTRVSHVSPDNVSCQLPERNRKGHKAQSIRDTNSLLLYVTSNVSDDKRKFCAGSWRQLHRHQDETSPGHKILVI